MEYDEILLLDSDTLAVTNIDDIFEKCKKYSHTLNDKICGFKNPSVRPSSRLEAEMWNVGNYINAGVLILSPSLTIFYDMMKKVGKSEMCCKFAFEQDFLNWYFTKAPAKVADRFAIAISLQQQSSNPSDSLLPWWKAMVLVGVPSSSNRHTSRVRLGGNLICKMGIF